MTLVRFNNAGYPVTRNLVNDLFRNFGYNDTYDANCGCVPSNVIENDHDYRLEISVPGFSKDEVKISFQKNILTVRSEKNLDKNNDIKYLHRGFVPKNFEKSFELSKHINTDQISANFNNGILEIVLPKKEEVIEKSPVEIEIQ